MAALWTFRNSEIWKKSQELVLGVFEVIETFPAAERAGLSDQMCRAAAAVTANIEEAFRRRDPDERLRSLTMAQASLHELLYFLRLSSDLGFLTHPQRLTNLAAEVWRLLSGFRASRERRQSAREARVAPVSPVAVRARAGYGTSASPMRAVSSPDPLATTMNCRPDLVR